MALLEYVDEMLRAERNGDAWGAPLRHPLTKEVHEAVEALVLHGEPAILAAYAKLATDRSRMCAPLRRRWPNFCVFDVLLVRQA
jgi:hypothetical protein